MQRRHGRREGAEASACGWVELGSILLVGPNWIQHHRQPHVQIPRRLPAGHPGSEYSRVWAVCGKIALLSTRY
jgi:hypothetical protein